MALKLAEHLRDKYKVNDQGEIVLIAEAFEFDSGKKYNKIVIPSEHIFVSGFKSKHNRNEISRCVNKITHAYLMKIKRDLNIQLEAPEFVKRPDEDKDLWGYCIIKVKDSDSYGDGEVHDDTLKGTMYAYAFTMMVKRAQDRAICNEIGLYSEGFYTEHEDLGDGEIVRGDETIIDYDDVKRDSVKEDDTQDKEEKEEKPKRGRRKKTEPEPEDDFRNDASSTDPDDEISEEEDDKTLIINKIKLLSNFMHLDTEEMSFHTMLEEGKDINSIDDLKDVKVKSLNIMLRHLWFVPV